MKELDPKKRMEICKKCVYLVKGAICWKCKCVLAAKTRVRWSDCPMGYWVKSKENE